MMLKDYAKTLYEVNRDNTRYCVISASIVDCSLHIHRTDYQEWEYNSSTGIVEGLDTLDEENTKKLCERFRITSSPNLVRILKREFGADGISFFLSNFREFCDDHNIKYEHQAWY